MSLHPQLDDLLELRHQARTHPDEVRGFLAEMGDKLSGLSRREASKHL